MPFDFLFFLRNKLLEDFGEHFCIFYITIIIIMLKKTYNFSLEIRIYRDTKNETETPDIVNTIFNKIERAKTFVVDISIVNSNSEGRKMPNLNVLLELRYAAKVVGLESIICVFNKDFGEFENLPFDLRFRRTLVYNLKDKNKSEVRESVVKVKVDKIILTITNSLSKMLFGYETIDTKKNTSKFLNLSENKIKIIF